MRFRDDFLNNYLKETPAALALERTLECQIYSKLVFTPPILDIGCGEGIFAHILFKDKIDVGIDVNQRELDRARQYDAYDELVNATGDNIPKGSDTFNSVFSNSVLEHISDLDPVLREINRVMTVSGDLYVTVPTKYFDQYSLMFQLLSIAGFHALAERYRRFFNRFWRHFHYYDVSGWRELFEKNGFSVVASQGYAPKRVGILNDVLAILAFPAFLNKKLFNRWFIFNRFRALYSPFLAGVLRPVTENNQNDMKSGLVFFHLKKSPR